MITVDGTGMAAIIGATCAGLVSLGTLATQLITFFDTRRIKLKTDEIAQEGAKREGKLDTLHAQLNGRMTELKIKIAKEAYEMGRKYQKENGDAPSPDFPKTKVDQMMEQENA